MIVDAHAHACGEFADLRKLTQILDELRVDKVALCPGLKGHTSAPPLPNMPIAAIKQSYAYSQCFINPGLRFNYNVILKEKRDGNEFVNSLYFFSLSISSLSAQIRSTANAYKTAKRFTNRRSLSV